MKVQRTINKDTFSFELTPDELYEAYFEQRDKFDIEDVISYGELFSQNEFEEEFGCSYEYFLSLKEEIANEMRRNMDKYDMPFCHAREYAVKEVIRRNMEMAQ